jgi:HNH endonuclease
MNEACWGPFETEPNGWWTVAGAAAIGREVKRDTFRRKVIERARDKFWNDKRNARRHDSELPFHKWWLRHISQSPELRAAKCFGRPAIDLTGSRFGRLVVEARTESRSRYVTAWRCRCDCGEMSDVCTKHLRSGATQSCGCSRRSSHSYLHIELTQEIVRELLDYNSDTGSLTWRWRGRHLFENDYAWKMWNTRFAEKPALSTPMSNGYLHGTIFGKRYTAHRIIFLWVNGRWPDFEIDHENHSRSNNKLSNLVDKTHLKNGQNMSLSRANKSGRTWVFQEPNGKFRASFYANGSEEFLGYHFHFEDACAVREAAERKYRFHANHWKPRNE